MAGNSEYVIKQEPEDFRVYEESSVVPQETGRYTYFLLRKRNFTTEAAMQRIATQLNMPRRFFGFAGNKDKRAITEQVCSVSGNIRSFDLRELSVKVLGRGDEPISLGALYGNRFEIVVRNITSLPRKVENIVNYFDSQRFGIHNNNHLIGRMILKRDFKGAVEAIIENKEEMMTHLKLNPNDYVGAIRILPKKVYSMYINAYQSYVWNRSVGEYLSGRKADPDAKFPIVGFGTELEDPVVRGITLRILNEDDINQRSFIIKEIPELTSEGNTRRIFAEVSDMSIGKLEDDDLNKGRKKVLVKFRLGKGSYATMVIKEMFSF
jgi:tRNA pseudouridine13 synthase